MSCACTADEELTPEVARALELGRSMIEGEQPVTPATSEYGQVCTPHSICTCIIAILDVMQEQEPLSVLELGAGALGSVC